MLGDKAVGETWGGSFFFFFFRLEGSECWHTGGLGLMRALSPRRFCQGVSISPVQWRNNVAGGRKKAEGDPKMGAVGKGGSAVGPSEVLGSPAGRDHAPSGQAALASFQEHLAGDGFPPKDE